MTRRLLLLPVLAFVFAAAEPPQNPPLPVQKPSQAANETSAEPPAPASDTGAERETADVDDVPLPEERPDVSAKDADDDTSGDGREPDKKKSEKPVDRTPEPANEAELAQCEAQLTALGVTFERRDPIDGKGLCGVAAPYNMITAAPGVVVKPDTELTCAAALATAKWVANVVIPATKALGDDVKLTEVIHASTYVCRNRNSLSNTKVSEHAKGNAIDISRFGLDGYKPIPVVPRAGKGTIDEAFQVAVRKGACLYFTTVLGPGSDLYHDDHLHFDVIKRSRGYRLCQ